MKQQSITTLPPSPDAERRSRMIKYSVAMSIRMVCIISLLFVDGWWLAVAALGAIVLPYLAVVVANVGGPTRSTRVLRPGGVVARYPNPAPTSSAENAPAPPTDRSEQQPEPNEDERGAA